MVLFSEAAPQVYLLNRDDWTQDKSGLLKYRKYPNSKEPEFGIHLAKKREADLKRFAFKDRIARLQDGSNL